MSPLNQNAEFRARGRTICRSCDRQCYDEQAVGIASGHAVELDGDRQMDALSKIAVRDFFLNELYGRTGAQSKRLRAAPRDIEMPLVDVDPQRIWVGPGDLDDGHHAISFLVDENVGVRFEHRDPAPYHELHAP